MKIKKRDLLKIIQEVYAADDEDYEEVQSKINYRGDLKSDLKNKGGGRSYGLQSKEEIEADRAHMQNYQKTADVKGIHNAIKRGDITVFHAISYEIAGAAGATRKKKLDTISWLKKYGKKGNFSLSTIIVPYKYEDIKTGKVSAPQVVQNAYDKRGKSDVVGKNVSNINEVLLSRIGEGIIVTGYPVISAIHDLHSQTFGAVPSKLLKHQKQSGPKKRANPDVETIDSLDELVSSGGSEETILDNWTVKAIYMTSRESKQTFNEKNINEVAKLIKGYGNPSETLGVQTKKRTQAAAMFWNKYYGISLDEVDEFDLKYAEESESDRENWNSIKGKPYDDLGINWYQVLRYVGLKNAAASLDLDFVYLQVP